jgi:pantoate--beta-alanine ligase
MKVIKKITELPIRSTGLPRVFVPTMGALHAGHGELIRVAKTIAKDDGDVIVSIFVNPLQFGANEDYAAYPRTASEDIETASNYGADYLWFPEPEELLVDDIEHISSPELGSILEGEFRPGHFDGMLTMVNRLFKLVQPSHAIFGVKDLQQLILVREMAEVRFPNLQIIAVETLRNEFGLALSSRNKYLSQSQLMNATEINRALNRAALSSTPERVFIDDLIQAGFSEDDIDYVVKLKMPENCADLGNERLVVAVRIGTTRLLDNIALN